MKKELVLILGGARSGKSSFAQTLAEEGGGKVLYVATATVGDEEMRRRIEKHRMSRPGNWATLEEPLALAASIGGAVNDAKFVIVDCLTVWLANLLSSRGIDADDPEPAADDLEQAAIAELGSLLECFTKGVASFVFVSNEVGLGVVPPYPLGRLYRDLLGRINQFMAVGADKVFLLVAGIPVDLKLLGRRSPDASTRADLHRK